MPYDTPDAVENLCNAYEQAITHSRGKNAMTKQETYDYLTTHGVDFEVTEHPAECVTGTYLLTHAAENVSEDTSP